MRKVFSYRTRKSLSFVFALVLALTLAIPHLSPQQAKAAVEIPGIKITNGNVNDYFDTTKEERTKKDYGSDKTSPDQFKNIVAKANVAVLGYSGDPDEYLRFWHFVLAGNNRTNLPVNIMYRSGSGQYFTVYDVYSYDGNKHYGVVTPLDWILVGAAWSTSATSTNNFNLSHTEKLQAKTVPPAPDGIPPSAQITIEKTVDGEKPSGKYEVLLKGSTGGQSVSFTLNEANNYSVTERISAGTYTVTEKSGGSFAGSFYYSVDGGAFALADGGSFSLTLDARRVCSLLVDNGSEQPSTISRAGVTIQKRIGDGSDDGVLPGRGGSYVVELESDDEPGTVYSFTLTPLNGYSHTNNLVKYGKYTIIERGEITPAAIATASSLTPVGDVYSIEFDEDNNDVVITVFNDAEDDVPPVQPPDIEPPDEGDVKVTITKTIDGVAAASGEFMVTMTGSDEVEYVFYLDESTGWSDSWDLDAGEYSIVEKSVSGYKLNSITVKKDGAAAEPVSGGKITIGVEDQEIEIVVDNTVYTPPPSPPPDNTDPTPPKEDDGGGTTPPVVTDDGGDDNNDEDDDDDDDDDGGYKGDDGERQNDDEGGGDGGNGGRRPIIEFDDGDGPENYPEIDFGKRQPNPDVPGGSDRSAPPVANDPGHRLTPQYNDDGDLIFVEFDDDDVPLGAWGWEDDGWIFDDWGVPLGDFEMPQTGVFNAMLWIMPLGLVFLGFGLIMRFRFASVVRKHKR